MLTLDIGDALAFEMTGFGVSCHYELENHSHERSNFQYVYTTTKLLNLPPNK